MVKYVKKSKFKSSFKKKKFRRIKGAPLVATLIYDAGIAKSFHNTSYYEAQSEYQKTIVELEEIKRKLSTGDQERVTKIFEEYKAKAEGSVYKVHNVLFKSERRL